MALNLKSLKDERNRAEEESDRLNKMLDESITTLKNLEKESRQLEVSNSKLDNILAQAEKDHANVRISIIQLMDEMKQKEREVDSCNNKLSDRNDETEDLTAENNRLEKECEKAQSEYK